MYERKNHILLKIQKRNLKEYKCKDSVKASLFTVLPLQTHAEKLLDYTLTSYISIYVMFKPFYKGSCLFTWSNGIWSLIWLLINIVIYAAEGCKFQFRPLVAIFISNSIDSLLQHSTKEIESQLSSSNNAKCMPNKSQWTN